MFWRRRSNQRHVLLHYHIFKNAGTTIDSILRANLDSGFTNYEGNDHNSSISNEELLRFLAANPKIKALSSHHLRPPRPEDARFVFHDIVFLRNPLARLSSSYEFYRRAETSADPLTVVAKERNIRDFFNILLDSYPSHACNAQVNFLANAGHQIPIRADLLRACERALAASFLGVVELFDESIVWAEYTLRLNFGALDFSYVAQNVTTGQTRSLDKQLAKLSQECGEDTYTRLQEANQLDLELLKIADEDVLRRLRCVPRHERRIESLRAKCVTRLQDAAKIVLASNHPHSFEFYANLCSRAVMN